MSTSIASIHDAAFERDRERRRDAGYPISRWYLRPAAGWIAGRLAPTPVRPVHLTTCGLIAAAWAGGLLAWRPEAGPAIAGLALAAWFFDRADGQLARCQGTASRWGAWLDANVDELGDLGLHVAVAWAAASLTTSSLPWVLLIAFLVGKYLLMYGLAVEESATPPGCRPRADSLPETEATGWLRWAWHLPGNADVRVHLLVAALLSGWLTAELALVAVYYNLRWIARYVLVARRLGGAAR